MSGDDFDSILAMVRNDKHLMTMIASELLGSGTQVARVLAINDAFRNGDEALAVLYARNLSDDLTRTVNEHARTVMQMRQAHRTSGG